MLDTETHCHNKVKFRSNEHLYVNQTLTYKIQTCIK